MKRPLLLGLGLTLALPLALPAQPFRVESPSGITVQLDPASGQYEVAASQPGWTFAGELGHPARDAGVTKGKDRIGEYQEIHFKWPADIPLSGGIRVYSARPVVLFTLTCERASESLPALFPRFTRFPAGLHHFSHRNDVFAPPSFRLENNGTPWLLFDDQDSAVVISPADHFMVATMIGDGTDEIACGLNAGVRHLPARFTTRALMAFDRGIGAAWNAWGTALTDLEGRVRPANDADIGLRYLGYWTDNGATYYYNYDRTLGYAGTLEKLVNECRENGIPIRYLQLDSWWYYKSLTDPDGKTGRTKNNKLPEGEWNRYGGLLKYEAPPALFSKGLAAFQKKIGLPLITHNRWIDPASPYRQRYAISGYAAIDPRWWKKIIGYIAGSGVVCYEQDWLNVIYNHSPALQTTLNAGSAFTGDMARAAQAKGLSLQYCMALPRFFLQGSRYPNLTTIRVSDDRFKRARWDAFLYNCQFAGALGIWPWSDVFMSGETNNLLLATLSGGMVGTGDAIGHENKPNLLRVARPDGVLVKPDVPLVPLDEAYLADTSSRKSPMIAWTRTDHGRLRTAYVFAYNRQEAETEATFTPTEFGLSGEVCVLDVATGSARRQSAGNTFTFKPGPRGTAYYEIAPVGQSGVAFFGDEGKFVSTGKKRISAIDDQPGRLTVAVTFAAGEKPVRLFGYADRVPKAAARRGTVGDVSYDPSSGRFSVEVAPAPPIGEEAPGGDPIQTAVVEFITGVASSPR